MEKTIVGGSQTAKFMNVFTLESFLLYGITYVHVSVCTDCDTFYNKNFAGQKISPTPATFVLQKYLME